MNFRDEDIRRTVEAIFDRYDKNKEGFLEASEVAQLLKDMIQLLNPKQVPNITAEHAREMIKKVDRNGDGKVTKIELFIIFKRFLMFQDEEDS